jgi:hypothetical protein
VAIIACQNDRICTAHPARARHQLTVHIGGSGFKGTETLLTECDLGEAAGRFIDGGQNNRIPADFTRVAATARAFMADR